MFDTTRNIFKSLTTPSGAYLEAARTVATSEDGSFVQNKKIASIYTRTVWQLVAKNILLANVAQKSWGILEPLLRFVLNCILEFKIYRALRVISSEQLKILKKLYPTLKRARNSPEWGGLTLDERVQRFKKRLFPNLRETFSLELLHFIFSDNSPVDEFCNSCNTGIATNDLVLRHLALINHARKFNRIKPSSLSISTTRTHENSPEGITIERPETPEGHPPTKL